MVREENGTGSLLTKSHLKSKEEIRSTLVGAII